MGLKNRYICEAAVAQDPYAIEFVPHDLQTEGMCLHVVRLDGRLLRFIPDGLKTEIFVKLQVKIYMQLNLFRLIFKPKRCVYMLFQNMPYLLKFVSPHLQTEEMCLHAVQKLWTTFEVCLIIFKTERICEAAVACKSICD